ncbi:MAG: toprim domain-containing protein, partial [Planctomycetaceae bacterium]
YTDCIAAHQAGIKNVVATLGTALTEMQVTTIKRFARKVVLVYDGDQAGLDASERAVSRFLAQDVDLRILTLPDGQDPADFLANHGVDALGELIDKAPEAFDFVFGAYRRRFGIETIDSRQRIMNEVIGLLATVPQLSKNVREKLLLQRTAERLGIAEEVVHQQYQLARRGSVQKPAAQDAAVRRIDRAEFPEHAARILKGQPTRDDRLECELLQCLVAALSWTGRVRREIGAGDFTNPSLRNIAQACFDIDESGLETLAFTQLLSALDGDEPAKQLAVWLDEQAVTKRLNETLRPRTEQDQTITTDDCPLLLRRSLDELKWRREEQSHKRMAIELSEQCEGARSLDAEAERLLRQFSDYHQKRATKKASG